MLRLKLHWQVLIALILAVIAGLITGKEMGIFGVSFYAMYDFIGTLFLNALKMLIVPLIVSSIIVGISGTGGTDSLGRLGGKTLLYYMATSFIAIMIGLFVANLIQPGIIDGTPAKDMLGLSGNTSDILTKVEGRDSGDLVEVFLRMIPTNVVSAAADGQMLGLIVFSLLFGYFITKVQNEYGKTVHNFWQGVAEVMMLMTHFIMKFAPIGVFGLVAKVVAVSGLDAFRPLLGFFFTVLLALAIHLFIVMPLILRFVGGIKNPFLHFRAMFPALLTAFSTSSSSATLPVTMECVEKNAGVSERTTSFVLPLGATVNMDGTALYECVAVLFIAQAYGLDMTLGTQFVIVMLALLTSVGVAGIPAASLVAITIILAYVGLPAEAIGLILAVDRLLDMCRTSVNVFSDSCGAVVVGRLEGEKGILRP